MIASLLFCAEFSGLVSCDTRIPTFTWQKERFSPEGVPLLNVNFHDGKPADVVVFKHLNPIERQESESEDKIDRCIFAGFLRDESATYVVLTGGCPFEDSFEVWVLTKSIFPYFCSVKLPFPPIMSGKF